MGGPCQHLHPNKQAGSRKSLSREEVSEMDRGKGDGSEGVGLADSHHISKCCSHLPVGRRVRVGCSWRELRF